MSVSEITHSYDDDLLEIDIFSNLSVSDDAMNEELVTLMLPANQILIASEARLVIDAPIFEHYKGIAIDLDNVILTKVALESIPESVKFFNTNMVNMSQHSLKVQNLEIPLPNNGFLELPESVEKLDILPTPGETKCTLFCSDNLKQLEVYDSEALITLQNCNNLEYLRISGINSYVWGDFMNYLSRLSVDIGDKEYISEFKLLKRLDIAFGSNLSVDDIPDTVEIFDGTLTRNGRVITSSEILARKPNITTIRFQDSVDSLKDYPTVTFMTSGPMSNGALKAIRNHNNRVVELARLARE